MSILNSALDIYVSKHYNDVFVDDNIELYYKLVVNEKGTLEELYDEFYEDVFIEKIFNSYLYSFYEESKDILKRMKSNELIQLLNGFYKWDEDKDYVDQNMFEEENKLWNILAYYVVKTNDRIKNIYFDTFKEGYEDYIDTYNYRYTTYSRIPCGICFEHKTLHTGCSCCNNNYVCGNCYINIDIKKRNHCPFCRCKTMIKEFSVDTIEVDEELKKIKDIAMGKIKFGKDY